VAAIGPRGGLSSARRLEILTIGTELLLGATVDGNGSWLSRRLAEVGIRVPRRVTVGDDVAEIRSALADALARSGAVICTGGLGPTRDDVTRAAVAELFGRALMLDAEWLETVRGRFHDRGIEMPAVNRVQAEIPEGATLFPNDRGTAPGVAIEDDALGIVVLLPGVPREMRGLFNTHVLPYLSARGFSRRSPVLSRSIRTTGIAESALAERIDDLVEAFSPLTLAFLPGGIGEDVRITCWGDLPPDEAARALDAAEAVLRERLGRYVYGSGSDDLAAVLGDQLRSRDLTIAIAESCTGGLVAKRLTDTPGSSDYVLAAVVAYANQAKERLLGVSRETIRTHGAVSEQTACEMAAGARRLSDASLGVSITGIAGPGGGTPEKPVGTVWIGVAHADRVRARLFRFGGDRSEIRERAAQAALAYVRLTVLEDSAQ
jgi:nicotinamide-nucleotide amidase